MNDSSSVERTLAELAPLPSWLDPEGSHDYKRCARCGYLDRTDHIHRRGLYHAVRVGCARCENVTFVEPFRLTAKEIKRIRSGWYETYHEDPAE